MHVLFTTRGLFRDCEAARESALAGRSSATLGLSCSQIAHSRFAFCKATRIVRKAQKRVASHIADRLFMQDDTQEGSVDMQPTIVIDIAEFLEFIHEQINPPTSRSDHFCQGFL